VGPVLCSVVSTGEAGGVDEQTWNASQALCGSEEGLCPPGRGFGGTCGVVSLGQVYEALLVGGDVPSPVDMSGRDPRSSVHPFGSWIFLGRSKKPT
jgi:hypothetical protein